MTTRIFTVVSIIGAAAFGTNSQAIPFSGALGVGAGGEASCAIMAGGALKCWGERNLSAYVVPGDVPGLSQPVLSVAGGESYLAGGHMCALTTSGGVKCWGNNFWGQLGDGDAPNSQSAAVDVVGLTSGATAIGAGSGHACAVTTSGGIKCWGYNSNGQLGDGTKVDRAVPVDVASLGGTPIQVVGGGSHTCALMTNGGVKCWGLGNSGQLGQTLPSTQRESTTPLDVAGLSGAVSIAASGASTCALTSAGGVKCWGAGFGATPVDVAGLENGVAAITAGGSHFCVRTTAGAAKCWGYNVWGMVGDGTNIDRSTPVGVVGLSTGVAAIAAGIYHTCALLTSGSIRCWGRNWYDELGLNNGNPIAVARTRPVTVGTFTDQIITFAALAGHDINEAPFAVSATASSGLPADFSTFLTPAVCSASGSMVTVAAIGICTVAANQAGDETYGAAMEIARSFLVTGQSPTMPTRLSNISTRMQSLAGNNALIAGFAVNGPLPKTVVIRARGPSLAAQGVTNTLADPSLQIFSGQNPIAANDNWQQGTSSAMLQDAGFAPTDPHESALLRTLQPGLYTAIVSGHGGTGVAIVEVFEIDTPDSPLINISTRGQVLTGNDAMIGGFIINGNSPQTVVVRARGPSLASQGVSGVLADPMLQIVRSSDQTVIATNDDWQGASNACDISASGFAPLDPKESAVLMTLPPGAYTAIVTGVNATIGVGLVEVFAATQPTVFCDPP